MVDELPIEFNWDVFPSTRLEESQISSPIGCSFTPFNKTNSVPLVCKNPISCQQCMTLINPFIKLDRTNDMWWCPFCRKRTYISNDLVIPDSAKEITDWPMELRESSNCIDYELPKDITFSTTEQTMIYYIVIDKYQHSESQEFQSLLNAISKSLENIPQGSLVGLMTYDSTVHLHDIKSGNEVQIAPSNLGLFEKKTIDDIKCKGQSFIEVNDENRQIIVDYIMNLKPTYSKSFKPSRCTGFAHYVYSILLSQSTFTNLVGNVLFFTSGPGTQEPGKIVDGNANIRSHQNIADLEAPYLISTMKFYSALSYLANGQSFERSYEIAYNTSKKTTEHEVSQTAPIWTVNLFVGSLDQVGAYEMKQLIQKSSGVIYLFESFTSYRLLPAINKVLETSQYRNTLEVSTSTGMMVSKLLFGGYELPSSYHKASKYHHLYHEKIDDQLGEFDSAKVKKHFTNRWNFNRLNINDTLGVYFKMVTASSSKNLSPSASQSAYIQFRMKYWNQSSKKWMLRVFTLDKPTTFAFEKQGSIYKRHKLSSSFNQKSWIVLLTRLLINRIDTSLGFDSFDELINLIDSNFARLLHNFGALSIKSIDEKSDNPYTKVKTRYAINENLKDLPSLVYNLRKNHNLIKIFNSSPDETAFNHLWFMRMNLDSSLKVIEPTLVNFMDKVPVRLPLNTSCFASAGQDTFLILDTGFQFVIYFNSPSQKLDLHPSNNEDLITRNTNEIQEPLTYLQNVTRNRQYLPKIIITQTNHSQSRFLMSRLNSIDESSLKNQNEGSWWNSLFRKPVLLTEDISLNQYYNNLIQQIDTLHI